MNQHAHEHHHRHDHRGFAVLRRDVQVASPRADIGRFGHRQRVGLARDEPAVEVSDHSLSNRRIPVLVPLDALLQWHVRQVDDLDGRCLASCDPSRRRTYRVRRFMSSTDTLRPARSASRIIVSCVLVTCASACSTVGSGRGRTTTRGDGHSRPRCRRGRIEARGRGWSPRTQAGRGR